MIELRNYIRKNLKRVISKSLYYDIRTFFCPMNCIYRKGLIVDHRGALLRNVKILTYGYGNHVVISPEARLVNCNFEFHGKNCVVQIGKGCSCEDVDFYLDDDSSSIIIGNNTSFGKTHLAAIEGCSINIGEDCMFSSGIVFQNGDSHSVVDIQGMRINPSEDITIGDHVWVGRFVICEKGSKVSDNSIIGAGALVNKKFNDENVVIAGVPAKIVKRNINWKRERI